MIKEFPVDIICYILIDFCTVVEVSKFLLLTDNGISNHVMRILASSVVTVNGTITPKYFALECLQWIRRHNLAVNSISVDSICVPYLSQEMSRINNVKCNHVKAMSFYGIQCVPSDDELTQLLELVSHQLTALHIVDCSSSVITFILSNIPVSERLTALTVNLCDNDLDALSAIRQLCVHLTYLDVSNSPTLRNCDVVSMIRMTTDLKVLNVANCILLNTPMAICILESLSDSLQILNISGCCTMTTDELVAVLNVCTKLKMIDATGCCLVEREGISQRSQHCTVLLDTPPSGICSAVCRKVNQKYWNSARKSEFRTLMAYIGLKTTKHPLLFLLAFVDIYCNSLIGYVLFVEYVLLWNNRDYVKFVWRNRQHWRLIMLDFAEGLKTPDIVLNVKMLGILFLFHGGVTLMVHGGFAENLSTLMLVVVTLCLLCL